MKNSRHTLPEEWTEISSLRAMTALGLDWLLIVCCFACAIRFPHPAVYGIAAVLIARTQLALAVLMHESAHGIFLPGRKMNDIIGQVCTAAPLMLSMFAYRKGHLEHHRTPMEVTDPVATVFQIGDYPITKSELVWRLFKDVTGMAYVLSVRDFISGKYRDVMHRLPSTPTPAGLVPASILATNAGMATTLAVVGHPWLYLGLWVVPALTLLQLFARVRAITEHAGYTAHVDQTQNARSIVRRNWQTFFFGPHYIHYHIEHHQYVRVPFYHLPKVHRFMLRQAALPAANLYRGYGHVLKDVSS